LATDNLTQDMAEAMRWALATARVRLGEVAADWQPEDALAMATTNGAKALRMADTLGRIAPGYAADLVAFDMARAHLTPLLDPLGTIVHDANGRDVANVWVAGRQVVRDGAPTLADAAAIRREAQAAAEALWARAGQDDPPEHATATARGG
jgi:5-methylthioadenosine/S-adenosylhomocysteine deaminase